MKIMIYISKILTIIHFNQILILVNVLLLFHFQKCIFQIFYKYIYHVNIVFLLFNYILYFVILLFY